MRQSEKNKTLAPNIQIVHSSIKIIFLFLIFNVISDTKCNLMSNDVLYKQCYTKIGFHLRFFWVFLKIQNQSAAGNVIQLNEKNKPKQCGHIMYSVNTDTFCIE